MSKTKKVVWLANAYWRGILRYDEAEKEIMRVWGCDKYDADTIIESRRP